MIDSTSLPTLNAAVDKLMRQLIDAKEDLRRCDSSEGKGWSPIRSNRLRERVASIEKRLERAERLQDQALASGDR